MFKKSGEYKQAFLLATVENGYVVKSLFEENLLIKYDLSLNVIWEIHINESAGLFLEISKQRMIFFEEMKSKFYSINTGEYLKSENRYYYYLSDSCAVYVEMDDSNKVVFSNSIGEITKYEIVQGINSVHDNDYFINISNQIITVVYISTGEVLFRLNLLEVYNNDAIYDYGIAGNELHISGNMLFIYYTDGKDFSKTICINILDGSIVWDTSEFGGLMYMYDNMLYNIFNQRIRLLDMSSFKITEITINNPTIIENNWYIMPDKSFVFDNQIYFAARSGDGLYSNLGVWDINTNTLVYHTELLKDESKPSSDANRYAIMNIKADQNYIFVHAAGNTLHIYKKLNAKKDDTK
jgi:hypothetical protein